MVVTTVDVHYNDDENHYGGATKKKKIFSFGNIHTFTYDTYDIPLCAINMKMLYLQVVFQGKRTHFM